MGKLKIRIFFDKKGNLKRKLKQQSVVGFFEKSLTTVCTTPGDLI